MIRKSGIRNIITKSAALLFVLTYASSLFLTQLHQFAHEAESEEVVCYEEENACHLRLIHNDSEKGCDHESHFSDEQPSCELCPLLQAKTESSNQDWQIELVDFNTKPKFGEYNAKAYLNLSFHLSSRGPPINS